MLNHKNIIKIYVWIIGFTVLSLGCAHSQSSITPPEGTRMVIFVSEDAQITAVKKNGEPALPCQLCDENAERRLGEKCAKAPAELPPCQAIQNQDVKIINTVTILKAVTIQPV